MKRNGIAIFLFLLVSGMSVAAAENEPWPISGFADQGVFKLLVRDTQVGTIQFKLDASGRYERKFTLAMAGQTADYFMTIAADGQGKWTTVEIKTPTDTVAVQRVAGRAEFTVKDKKYSSNLTNRHILYDNYGPVFESFLLKAYDQAKGGKQKFSRFIVPQNMMDMEVEFKGKELRPIGQKEVAFQRFDLSLLGLTAQIWADSDLHVVMFSVPAQYAAFVREGFEDLLKVKSEDPLLSKPEFSVSRRTIQVPMRDGVKLSTDLYLPVNAAGRLPLILIRTPYKKEMSEMEGNWYAKRGYAAAIQDCRGRFASEGVWDPFFNEPADGYDSIEWLAGQEWCSGKVGMVSGSYVGWVQLWAASQKPPHLVTIIPNVAPPDPFYNIPYEYGTFFIYGSIWWAEILESGATGDLSGKAMSKIGERKYERILRALPVIDLDKQIFGKENRYWRDWIKHPVNDGYWERANFLEKLKTLNIPVFLQSGWFDGDGIGSKLNYLELKKSQNKFQKLILGPWGHSDVSSSHMGEIDFGPEAAPDLKTLYLRWFDYWLKGIDNKIVSEPLVQMFVMFGNKWLKGDTYPLPETVFSKFYFSSRKGANTSRGDGRLQSELPQGGRAYDAYTYNPADPTPYPGWYAQSEAQERKEKQKTIALEEEKKQVEAFHNRVTDSRKDILVFQSEPLKQPLTVAGPVSAVLYASSSAKDTDWFVSLMDVDEKGVIFPLCKGTVRARFRNSTKSVAWLEKNKIYEYTVDLWHTGITFRPGHRIRVEVASALFPFYSRNLNTGGRNEMDTRFIAAKQRIYHSAAYPSHLLLPVIPQK